MLIRFNESTFVDLLTGARYDKEQKKALPFTSDVVFKMIKPSTVYKKKIGDTWISSMKLSLAYLMGHYMLRNDKKRVAGFYLLNDGQHLVIEFEMSNSPRALKTNWSIHRETPQDYLSIEGKAFDAICGNTEVSNVTIDFPRLYKEAASTVSPANMAAYILIILVASGLLYYMLAPTPAVNRGPVVAKDAPPPKLTEAEKESLQAAMFYQLIDEFNKLAAESGTEKVFSAVQASASSTDMAVTARLTVKFISFYPFEGAVKEGDHYSWDKNVSIEKGRPDIAAGSYREGAVCLGEMLKGGWDVTQRSGDVWHLKLADNSYSNFIHKVNTGVGCQVSLKSLTLTQGVYTCELDLRV